MKKIGIILGVIVVCALLFLALNQNTKKESLNKTADKGTNIPTTSISVDRPIASNFEELKQSADYIVIGQFEKMDKTWNAARDPENPEKESTTTYFEARVYDFKVTKVLKGKLDKDIKVSLIYSRKIEGSKEPIIDEYFDEPELNKQVVLFLAKDAISGYYYPSIQPYMSELTKDNKYQIKTNIDKLNKLFDKNAIDENELAK